MDDSGLDEWISLATNGALGLTGFYAYRMERFDLATLAVFGLCTSLVWHSSGKFQQMDAFISRYIAYYAFGTSAVPPAVIGPAVLILVVFLTFEQHVEEMYVIVPLVALLLFFKWNNNTITWRFVAAVGVGVGALVCYTQAEIGNVAWHSMWHVLGAIAVALTIEPLHRTTRKDFQHVHDALQQQSCESDSKRLKVKTFLVT